MERIANHYFANMENALEELAVRMEFPADTELNDDLEVHTTAIDGSAGIDDTVPVQPQRQTQTQETWNSSCSDYTCEPCTHTPITRHSIIRNVLLDPVKEWRNVPEEYRNDKSFILQFLHECNKRKLPLPSKDDFERKFPFYLRQDRDIVHAISQRYDFPEVYEAHHSFVPEQYKDDKYIMLSYCKTIKRSLQECSYRLQDDIDIVTTAIRNDGMELQYASSEMQQNEMILRQACRNNICALNFCSSNHLRGKLLCDYDFVVQMLRTAGESRIGAVDHDHDDCNSKCMTGQMKYAKKILASLIEPLRSNKELLLLAMKYNILSYLEMYRSNLKHQNDIELLIDAINRRSSVYIELCQLASKEAWYKSTATFSPSAPSNSCGDVVCNIGIDSSINHDCHRIAYAAITSSTSDATIIGKVFENIPTFLTSPEYTGNILVHTAIVDRADIAYVNTHLKETFPYLCSNVQIMTRAIQRDCNLFVACTEKDDPNILTAAMNADTAYPLLCTKPVDYVLEHINDVLLHVIRVSKTYEMLRTFVPDQIWNDNIMLQKAWIKRKGPLLQCTVQLLNGYLMNEVDCPTNTVIRDLSLYIAEYNSEEFFHVPLVLRSEFNFMLTALRLSSGNVMKDGCRQVQQNMECAIHAVAYSSMYSAFTYVRDFTPRQVYSHIQRTLSYHDTFVNLILCTIYQTENSREESNHKGNDEITPSSPITILNCGHETSTALLQRIVAFAGIPVGQTYTVYENAHRIMYRKMNYMKPSSTSTTTANEMGTTTHVANENVQLQRHPIVDADTAQVQNLEEFQRAAGRLRREAHVRAAMIRHADGRENVGDEFFDFDTDEEDNILAHDDLSLFNVPLVQQHHQLPPDDDAVGDAGPAPNQQPLPDNQPVNDIDRFISANMVEQIERPPRAQIHDRFLDPLVPLGPFHFDEHPAILRAIRRRRNNEGREAEFQMLRTLLDQRLPRPPLPPP